MAPSKPVDEKFRPVSATWVLPYRASSNIIQLNHYFARTCGHFFSEKRLARLAGRKAQYGSKIPQWELNRLSMGLDSMNEENCRTLDSYFPIPDPAIVEIGRIVWAKIDSEARDFPQMMPPPRSSCRACLPQALCVDLLQGNGNSSKAECLCPQPMIGDGRTFCGNVTWAASVMASRKGNFTHVLNAPDGDLYASHWPTTPRSKEYRVFFFGPNNARSNSRVRMILIYQPFSPTQIMSLSYTHRHRNKQKKQSTHINLKSIQQQFGDKIPRFMMIPVNNITLISLFLRFDYPIVLGGVGLVS